MPYALRGAAEERGLGAQVGWRSDGDFDLSTDGVLLEAVELAESSWRVPLGPRQWCVRPIAEVPFCGFFGCERRFTDFGLPVDSDPGGLEILPHFME